MLLSHCGRLVLLSAMFTTLGSPANGAPLDGSGALWAPYLEWSFDNPSYSGNPFDLVASVTFTHVKSGATHTTEMFFDGGTTWKVRFAGTRVGTWEAASVSADPELDGLSGTISITRGSARYGFGASIEGPTGTKWGRQTGSALDNGTPVEAWVPQYLMYTFDPKVYENNPAEIELQIQTFFVEHGFNAFHVRSIGGYWFDIEGDEVVEGDNTDPDLRTLRALELLITTTYAAGGEVHIWAWGDRARRWTPTELAGGKNGLEDQRLQRTIAARFGPIAGWSMGYGFDLDEWVEEEELHTWRDFLQGQLGWFHFLGGRPLGPNSGTDHSPWVSWNSALDYSSYEHHEPDYDVYVAAVDEVPGLPVFSEDRFRIRGSDGPGKDYTTEQTRRGLWHSAFAGGVANIWGNYTEPDGSEIPTGLSLPYPEPEWSRTYADFFEGESRFRNDLERAPSLTNGNALRTPDDRRFLFYIEDATSIDLDLSTMNGDQPAILVDTTLPYAEIDLGLITPIDQTLALPSESDWAIAVGHFGGLSIEVSGSCPGTLRFNVRGATTSGAITLIGAQNEGSFEVPQGPCEGALVGLDSPVRLTAILVDATGETTIDRELPAQACGRWIAVVDATTCRSSNAVRLP